MKKNKPTPKIETPPAEGMIRYTLVLPRELHETLQGLATRDGVPLVNVMRQFLKVGLWFDAVQHSAEDKIIVRRVRNGVESDTEIIKTP